MVAKLYDRPPGLDEFDGIDGYEMYTRDEHGNFVVNKDSSTT